MKTMPTAKVGESAPAALEQQRHAARRGISPSVRASKTILQWNRLDGATYLGGLIAELESEIGAVDDGNLGRPIALLVAQAETLNAMFHELSRCAYERMGSGSVEIYMRLAFKAQAQSRATIQAIADLKNPRPVAYVQSNIANGPQQVNNSQAPASRAGEIAKAPNELLEKTHGERVDIRAMQSATAGDTCLETMGTVNGAKDSAG